MKKANTNTKESGFTFYLFLLVVLTTLTIFNLAFYLFSKPKVKYVVQNSPDKEVSFWQTFLESHPYYIEGWIQLTKLDIQNGDKSNAQIALENAKKINPNSEEVINLKKELGN